MQSVDHARAIGHPPFDRRACPLHPPWRTAAVPDGHERCGHCTGLISHGQLVDWCQTHRWLCETCVRTQRMKDRRR